MNRTSAHRRALRRNLAASLFEHGTITTTRQKAKFVQPFAERLVSLAKDGSLHARRRAITLLQERDICKVEDGVPVKETTVIRKLFSEIGPQYRSRNGGYTRIIHLPFRRIGDNGQLVMLQLVAESAATSAAAAPRRRSKSARPAKPAPAGGDVAEAAPGDSPPPVDQAETEPADASGPPDPAAAEPARPAGADSPAGPKDGQGAAS
ncbi:MAG: 50S ribosomal protein L17 [Sedimentisphaerales bacterium]|nr:50S ribosomal protein L17 [Sedimentisphaerales bacterium]